MISPDNALLEAWIQRRDADAMTEIVRRHAGMVYGTCRRILGNDQEAKDTAQECFLKLTTLERSGHSLAGLLHKMATNLSLNQLRGTAPANTRAGLSSRATRIN